MIVIWLILIGIAFLIGKNWETIIPTLRKAKIEWLRKAKIEWDKEKRRLK